MKFECYKATIPNTKIIRFFIFISVYMIYGTNTMGQSLSFYPPVDNKRDKLFNDGWLFHRGAAPGAENIEYDDSSWRLVTLPHDWSIEPIPDKELKGMFNLHPVPGEWNWIESDDNIYAGAGIDIRDWKTVKLPAIINGFKPKTYRWFRREIELTLEMAEQGVTIVAGKIDDADEFWINGHKIGDTGVIPKYQPQGHCISASQTERQYRVPPSKLKTGKNTLAFCVYNHEGKGGFIPPKKNHLEIPQCFSNQQGRLFLTLPDKPVVVIPCREQGGTANILIMIPVTIKNQAYFLVGL